MKAGTVTHFSREKRAGTINGDDRNTYSFLEADVARGHAVSFGTRVNFEASLNPAGHQAKRVRHATVGAIAPAATGGLTQKPFAVLLAAGGPVGVSEPDPVLTAALLAFVAFEKTERSFFELGNYLSRSVRFHAAAAELYEAAQGRRDSPPWIVVMLGDALSRLVVPTPAELNQRLTAMRDALAPILRLAMKNASPSLHATALKVLVDGVRAQLRTDRNTPSAPPPVGPPPLSVPPPQGAVVTAAPPPKPEPVRQPTPSNENGTPLTLVEQVGRLRARAVRLHLDRIKALAAQLAAAADEMDDAPFSFPPLNVIGRTIKDLGEASARTTEAIEPLLALNETQAEEHRASVAALEQRLDAAQLSRLPDHFLDALKTPSSAHRAGQLVDAVAISQKLHLGWLESRWFDSVSGYFDQFRSLLAKPELQDEVVGFVDWYERLPADAQAVLPRCPAVAPDAPLLTTIQSQVEKILEDERFGAERRARLAQLTPWIGDSLRKQLEGPPSPETDTLLQRAEALTQRLQLSKDQLHEKVFNELAAHFAKWPSDPTFLKNLEEAESAVIELEDLAKELDTLSKLSSFAQRMAATRPSGTAAPGGTGAAAPAKGEGRNVSFLHPLSRGQSTYAAELDWVQQPGVPYGVVKFPVRLKVEPAPAQKTTIEIEIASDVLNGVPSDWLRQFPPIRVVDLEANRTSRDFDFDLPLTPNTADLIASENRTIAVRLTASFAGNRGTTTLTWQGLRRELPNYEPPFDQTISMKQMEAMPLGVERHFGRVRDLVKHGRKSFRVHGPRRMGKTTLVKALTEHFESIPEVVVLPAVVAAECKSPSEVWNRVGDKLKARFNRPVDNVKGMVPDEGCFDAVRRAARESKVAAIYVLIDEAQALFVTSGQPHLLAEAMKPRLELDWGVSDTTRAPLLLGLIGQAHLPDLMGANLVGAIGEAFTTDGIQEQELVALLRGTGSSGLQSSSEGRQRLARASGNLFILDRLLSRVADICRSQGRSWFLEYDVEEAVRRLVDADRQRTETTAWSYVRDVLNESDDKNEWRPADMFPVAMAWSFVRGLEPTGERRRKIANIIDYLADTAKDVSIRRDRVEHAFTQLQQQRVLDRDDAFVLPVLEELLRGRANDAEPFSDELDRRALTRLGLGLLKTPPAQGDESTGGQASVYRSTYENRTAAVRRVRLATAKAEQRFIRELNLLEKLRDQSGATIRQARAHLPSLFATGVDPRDPDTGVVIYEWIDGQPLDVAALRPDAALMVLRGLGCALAALESTGILHRDIRPANILLRQGSHEPVLIDFGLGVAVDEIAKSTVLGGVLDFLPPEVLEQGVTQWTHAGDLFSVGKSVKTKFAPGRHDAAVDELLEALMHRDPAQRINATTLIERCDALLIQRKVQQRDIALRETFETAIASMHTNVKRAAGVSVGDFVAARQGVTAPKFRLGQVSEFLENTFRAQVRTKHPFLEDRAAAKRVSTFLNSLEHLDMLPADLVPFVSLEARAAGQLRNGAAHPYDFDNTISSTAGRLPRGPGEANDEAAKVLRLQKALGKLAAQIGSFVGAPGLPALVANWLSDE